MPDQAVLLHICCGPCAIYPVQDLRAQGFSVVGLFYNPNIHPLQEYLRRRQGAKEVARRLDLKMIWKDEEYEPGRFLRHIAFREASRCYLCAQMRLERTMSIAERGKFKLFSTTLLYSIHQKNAEIGGLGQEMAGNKGLQFLNRDFRSGWKRGVEQSLEWGIYRQQYCGCLYSEVERFSSQLKELEEVS
ncbi:MAG: epoxyqueuosine reductase QueH [Desulfovermiculus sp.]